MLFITLEVWQSSFPAASVADSDTSNYCVTTNSQGKTGAVPPIPVRVPPMLDPSKPTRASSNAWCAWICICTVPFGPVADTAYNMSGVGHRLLPSSSKGAPLPPSMESGMSQTYVRCKRITMVMVED